MRSRSSPARAPPFPARLACAVPHTSRYPFPSPPHTSPRAALAGDDDAAPEIDDEEEEVLPSTAVQHVAASTARIDSTKVRSSNGIRAPRARVGR